MSPFRNTNSPFNYALPHSPIKAVRNTPIGPFQFRSTSFETPLQLALRGQENVFLNTSAQSDVLPTIPPPETPATVTFVPGHTPVPSSSSRGRKRALDGATPSAVKKRRTAKGAKPLPVQSQVSTTSGYRVDEASEADTTSLPEPVPPTVPPSLEQQLAYVLQAIFNMGHSLDSFLYHISRTPTAAERTKERGWTKDDAAAYHRRTIHLGLFLAGEGKFCASEIVGLWYRHKSGRKHRNSEEMFSLSSVRPYESVRPVRPGLSSFSTQAVERRLVEQAREAVKPSGGLHVHIPTKKRPFSTSVMSIDWRNIGLQTHASLSRIHKRIQPLLWGLLWSVADSHSPESGKQQARVRRPIEPVVTTIISKLAFCRSPMARLGPMMEGLFNIASNVSFDRFRYDSHIGNTPSYNTVLKALYGLSQQAAKQTLDICRDPGRWFTIVTDNVQTYHRRRDLRLGRQNGMTVGMAATAWVAPQAAADPAVFDYDEKEKLRAECRRDLIQVDGLLRRLDFDHERKVFTFQWLWVLGNYSKMMSHLKDRANLLLRTEALLQKVPDEAAEVYPLPTTSGSETDLPEFLSSIVDFLKNTGQTAVRYLRRILPIGGDGLTFELFLKLQYHLQFHRSPYNSLRILNPLLQWWHDMWTNDSRIIDLHLISYASLDPSTLGHSASKIGRRIPKEQGKYNYHQACEILYLVADTRMLDCWRLKLLQVASEAGVDTSRHSTVFDVLSILESHNKLPSQEEFESYALSLHLMYTTENAILFTATGDALDTTFRGSAWSFPATSNHLSPAGGTGSQVLDALDAEGDSQEVSFQGDTALARSKSLMREAIRSREMVWSVAEGDVGRVWAQMKIIMFSFAGSSHKKYAQYLLETLIDLELESSPELAKALLSTGVSNMTGLPGGNHPKDLLQEYFQRIIEAIVQHKGTEFGEKFIREGIARNLHHFQRLKTEFLGGVGLNARSKRHTKPAVTAEVTILLTEYRETELHSLRPGRTYDESTRVETQYRVGVRTLRQGLLKQWTTRQMLLRGRPMGEETSRAPVLSEIPDDTEVGQADADTNVESTGTVPPPLLFFNVNEGDIEATVLDPVAEAEAIVAAYEASADYGSDDDADEDIEMADGSGEMRDSGFSTDEE